MWQQAFSFIEQASAASRSEDLTALFDKNVRRMGFDKLVIGALTQPQNYGADSPALHNSYPTGWVEHYTKSNYLKDDPVFHHVATHNMPFIWSDMKVKSRFQKTILQEAREMGIINGVSIPVHGAQNDLFCVNIATDCMDAALQAPLQQLRLMSVHLQTSYIRLFKDNREDDALFPSLTGRERDCLTLCALGKTSWEIGEILGISELTVNSYINNASTKLDANSRIFAVVKAIRLGLINP